MSTLDTSIPASATFRNNAGYFLTLASRASASFRQAVVMGLALLGAAQAAQLEVTWTDNSTDETGFKVERSLNGAAFAQIATVAPNVTSYVDANLPAGSYSYRIRAYSDIADSDYSSPTAAYIILATIAPSISSQPASQTVLAGSNVTFTVAADGSPSLTFQWSKNGSAISGATSATLSLATVTISDAGSYTVAATNSAGSAQSSAAILTVNPVIVNSAPTFVLQPVNQTAAPNSNVTLSVSVSGTPTPTLQWQKDGTVISGANSATLILNSVTATSAGSYRVVASNSVGTATSTAGVLTVSAANSAPVFVFQPANQTGTVGANVVLSASVNGNPTPSLQWQKDGVAIAGATSATLSLTNITFTSAGSYRVIASNSVGSATSAAALLTVSAPDSAPTFVLQPTNQNVFAGANVVFSTSASGNPTPSLQWQKDGVAIAGAVGPTLSLNSVTSATAGSYRVVASNSAGSATSSVALLTVSAPNSAPSFVLQPTNQNVVVGANVTLTASVSGNPTPSLQWLKDGTAISGAVNATLSLGNVTSSSAGSYRVVATNSVGNATSADAWLTVSAPNTAPSFVLQPSNQTGVVGANLTLSTSVAGNPVPSLQWQKDGVAIAGATNATLLLTNITPSTAGSYRAVASSSAGTATSSAAAVTVTVQAATSAPVFVSQPTSQTVNAGSIVSLIAIATGTPTPTYQWKKNGAVLVGATASSLTITADSSTAGSYAVTATNVAGSAVSASAQVAIASAQVVTSSRLVNASIRANAGQGADTLIVGFVTSGVQKSVLLRGIGPGLAPYTTSTTFADPLLTLYSGNTALMANDNWSDVPALQSVFSQVGAFALPSPGRDAALMASLVPNAYTAQITGNGSGMALVELYDTDANSTGGRIVNIAARASVNSSDNVVIVGFVVQGNSPKQVLIRGIGPSLTPLGVSGALSAPRLQLYQGSTLVQENAGWGGTQALTSAFAQVGAFPLAGSASKDAAFLTTLNPGAYTVILSGSNSTSGIALIELYEMP